MACFGVGGEVRVLPWLFLVVDVVLREVWPNGE